MCQCFYGLSTGTGTPAAARAGPSSCSQLQVAGLQLELVSPVRPRRMPVASEATLLCASPTGMAATAVTVGGSLSSTVRVADHGGESCDDVLRVPLGRKLTRSVPVSLSLKFLQVSLRRPATGSELDLEVGHRRYVLGRLGLLRIRVPPSPGVHWQWLPQCGRTLTRRVRAVPVTVASG